MSKSIAQGLPIVPSARIVAGVECSTAYSKKGGAMRDEFETMPTIGEFRERTGGRWFFYKANATGTMPDFPHLVRVSDNPINDWGFRYARVLKTVAYVAVDESADGQPIIEKWNITAQNVY